MGFLQFSIWVRGSAWRPFGQPELRYILLRNEQGQYPATLAGKSSLTKESLFDFPEFFFFSRDQEGSLERARYLHQIQIEHMETFTQNDPLTLFNNI